VHVYEISVIVIIFQPKSNNVSVRIELRNENILLYIEYGKRKKITAKIRRNIEPENTGTLV